MLDLPRCELGTWPTPVQRLDIVSDVLGVDVWIKLEEECGTWGGNKVRKLEYILGRARAEAVETLVGSGVGTSNWTSALAYHASRQGFATRVRLAGDVPEAYRRLYRSRETRVSRIPRPILAVDALRSRYRPDHRRTRWLPPGGSGTEGDVGCLVAGREIAAAIDAGGLPEPHRVFVATGTAGTAAGLALGMAAGGLHVPTVCVRVTARPYGTLRLVRKRLDALRGRAGLASVPVAPLLGDDRFFRPGYGEPNRASSEAIALAARDGIDLDATYAAKAFASLVHQARTEGRGPLLFLHTSPGPVPVP